MIVPRRGFAALIPTLILSFVLMIAAITASEHGLTIRQATIQREDALIAWHRALSCTSVSLLLLAQDFYYLPSPDGDEVALSLSESCTITSVQKAGGEVMVMTVGHAGKSVSRIEARIGMRGNALPSLISWKEL